MTTAKATYMFASESHLSVKRIHTRSNGGKPSTGLCAVAASEWRPSTIGWASYPRRPGDPAKRFLPDNPEGDPNQPNDVMTALCSPKHSRILVEVATPTAQTSQTLPSSRPLAAASGSASSGCA